MIRDARNFRLNSSKPIQTPRSNIREITGMLSEMQGESATWRKNNFETDFTRYYANYLAVSGESIKPWDDANDHFLPVTNINVESYTGKFITTFKRGRNIVRVLPRGKDDAGKEKHVQELLHYQFLQQMGIYSSLEDGYRHKGIYGTQFYLHPWCYQTARKKIPGTYIYDTKLKKFIMGFDGTPYDFSGINIGTILSADSSLRKQDLYAETVLKDSPELQPLDIFNCYPDPNGGPDPEKHDYFIIESHCTISDVKTGVENSEYDEDQFNLLLRSLADPKQHKQFVNQTEHSDAKRDRDNVDGITNDVPKRQAVRLWACFFKYDINDDGVDEECMAVVANGEFLLRIIETPYQIDGVPWRPVVADHFIRLPHRVYGVGIAQILESLNYILNSLFNQILNHGDLYNSPPLVTPVEGDFNPDLNIFGPGQHWQSDNPDGFKILNTPDIKSSQVAMIQFVEGFIQKTLGISDFSLGGGVGSIVPNQTAHGIANVLRETNSRIDAYARSSNEFFLWRVFNNQIKLNQVFLEETVLRKITDSDEFDFEEIFNEDIQGMFDLSIDVDTVSASQEFEQAKWNTILQTLGGVVDPITQQPVFNIKELARKSIESYGEPWSDKFMQPENQPGGVIQPGQGGGGQIQIPAITGGSAA